jgi:SsrA-binding protein
MSKPVATNRKAYRDYEIIETLECGIELKGSEVKSARESKMLLDGSFARLEDNEAVLYNAYFSPYEQASYLNVEPTRPRKLLLHKSQIHKLAGKITQKGFTLVPLKAYFSDGGFLKIEIALCKGKRSYDKRQALKRKESERAMRRIIKSKRSGR